MRLRATPARFPWIAPCLIACLVAFLAAPASAAPLQAPGEFEKNKEVLLGTADSYLSAKLYQSIGRAVDGKAWISIFVDDRSVAQELTYDLTVAGVDMKKVTFYVTAVDTIWMRDYGPMVMKDAKGKPVVVDCSYFYDRVNDDRIPQAFAKRRKLAYQKLPLENEGGNYMTDGKGNVAVTNHIYDEENDGLSRQDVDALITKGLGADKILVVQRMHEEGTGHIDMFSKFVSKDVVLVGQYPQGDVNHQLLEDNAKKFAAAGYQVVRIPMASHDHDVFRTYTNSVFVGGKALVPQYGEPADAEALKIYRSVGWDAVGIDSRKIIDFGGAIHCITMQIPE